MKLVLPVVLAAFLAFVLGWLASRSFHGRAITTTERALDVTPAHERKAQETVSEIERPVSPSEPFSPAAPVAETRASEGLISEALRKYALEELDAGWHETRKDPMPEPLLTRGFTEFEEALRRLPRDIGRRLAEQQTQTERLSSDDPFVVIDALLAGDLGPQVALVQDKQRFAKFFACAGGPALDGITLLQENAQTPIPSGSVIAFPAGIHDLERLPHRLRSSVTCVTIVGAGMDRTLLRFRGVQPNEKLDRFELRNCTIQTDCDAIALNAKAGVWRAERVRFIGFDCGAGSSTVFSVMRGAILELKGCRIEGGFGRHPEHGNLFDVRSGSLIHFEDCTIDMVRVNPGWWRNEITLILDRCRFTNLLDNTLPVDREDDGIVLNATTMELRPKDAGPIPKRDIAELFPAWIQPTKR